MSTPLRCPSQRLDPSAWRVPAWQGSAAPSGYIPIDGRHRVEALSFIRYARQQPALKNEKPLQIWHIGTVGNRARGSAQITARHTCQVLKVVVFALKQSIGIVGSPIPHLTTENKAVGIQSNSSSWGRVTPQQGLTALQSPPLAAMVSTCDTPQPGSASSVAVDFRIYDRLMGKVRRGGRESEDTPQKQDKSRKEARHALPSIRWPRRVRRLVGGGCAHLRSIQTQKQIHLF